MENAAGSGRQRAEGYTLVELVVVIAVVAVAAALSYPALAGLRRGQELESAAVGVARTLRLAHWRAAATGGRTRVASRRTEAGTWLFRLEREEGGAWIPDGAEQAVPGGTVVAIAGEPDKVFNPDGTCSFGSVTLRGPAGQVYRSTLVPATGRVRFYRGDREAGRGL